MGTLVVIPKEKWKTHKRQVLVGADGDTYKVRMGEMVEAKKQLTEVKASYDHGLISAAELERRVNVICEQFKIVPLANPNKT